MSRVRMLIYFGVTPYLVFDGDNLPSKAGTERERAKRREESKRKGLDLYKAGKVSQAHQELQKAVDVTPLMARQLIDELKRMNIQYVVAPYEADAQLAYLERKGIINGVLSEDSDLLVFGVKRLLTKLDQHGDCVEINRVDFGSCREMNLAGWTEADFRLMAILSGCDYLPSINKMGLKTAHRYVRKYKNADKVLRMLQFEGQLHVPVDYAGKLRQAELTFLHHRVFCPIARRLVLLVELDPGMTEADLPYIGEDVEPETAIGVACGDLHPMTKEPIFVRSIPSTGRSTSSQPRRSILASASDLKPARSLDSFFKPKRQPLAELDPNSLTPSPSQRRLLETYASTSWEGRPVSSAPQLSRVSSYMSATNAASRPSRSTIDRTAFLTRAGALSTYQPPKRQRLCSETESIMPAGEWSKSPFFSSTVDEPSPSIGMKTRGKKSRKSDFSVFSDDSLDDALLDLPEMPLSVMYPDIDKLKENVTPAKLEHDDQSAGVEAKTTADLDTVPETSPTRPSEEFEPPQLSREMIGASTAIRSQNLDTQTTAATSIAARDDPGLFEDLLEYHVRKQNEALRKTFVAQSPSRRKQALQTLVLSPRKATLAYSEQSLHEESVADSPNASRNGEITTIQRDFLRATFSYQSPSTQLHALKSLRQVQNPDGIVAIGRAALSALPSASLPRHDGEGCGLESSGGLEQATCTSKETIAKVDTEGALQEQVTDSSKKGNTVPDSRVQHATPRGSEDHIVPNSEDEGDPSAEEEEKPLKARMNLGKYVFTPA
jgi:5'-3' exonuclease